MLSLQEDARSRKISAEIMKHGLYKSVAGPCRRRIHSSRMSYSSTWSQSDPMTEESRFRMYQSLPATPMQSVEGTPAHSPTSSRRFPFGFLSRGTTPRNTSPVPIGEDGVQEQDCQGLASIFKPQPRYIRANVRSKSNLDDWGELSEERELSDDFMMGDKQSAFRPRLQLQNLQSPT